MPRIVNIGSIGGEVAVPHMAPYVASRFALVGYSDALRSERVTECIRVTTVNPGSMRTGSHVNALLKGQREKEYSWFGSMAGDPTLLNHRGVGRPQGLPVWASAPGDHAAGEADRRGGCYRS